MSIFVIVAALETEKKHFTEKYKFYSFTLTTSSHYLLKLNTAYNSRLLPAVCSVTFTRPIAENIVTPHFSAHSVYYTYITKPITTHELTHTRGVSQLWSYMTDMNL